MNRVLVTGAGGFVGRAVSMELARTRLVTAALRNRLVADFPDNVAVVAADLAQPGDWSGVFSAVSTVVHCAARVHIMNDQSTEPLAEFRRVNVEGALRLARQAAAAGVRRLVFVSSIGVNGGETRARPFRATDEAAPHTPYAASKHEAEVALRVLATETGMEVVIIRPPLVYGPNAPGNFASLMKWLSSRIPLPLGSVTENRRSLVALDNLVDLILTCIDHPAAANQTFLVSDGEDLSTAELLRRMGRALGTPARLIPVPVGFLNLGATMLGRRGVAQRLCGSLQVDITKTREMLGWTPPVSVDEGLRRTALHWLNTQGRSRR